MSLHFRFPLNPAPGLLWRTVAVGVCAALVPSGPLNAEFIALNPVADTSLMEVAPDNSNGGQEWLLAGTTQNFPRTRALLRFDFTGLIPPEVMIRSVRLLLEVTRQPRDGYSPSPFGLHRMLRPWGEGTNVATNNAGGMGAPAANGDATWNKPFANTGPTWSIPGGGDDIDFSLEASGQTFIYGTRDSPYSFSSSLNPQLLGDVQQWLDDPSSNFGWMLKCEEEDANFTARRFASREAPDGLGPRLYIEYQLVPEPGPLLLSALGLAVLFAHCQRRNQAAPEHLCHQMDFSKSRLFEDS